MIARLRALRGWLDRKEVGTSLALFRIATGLVVLYTLVPMRWLDVDVLVYADAAAGGYRVTQSSNPLVWLAGGATAAGVVRLCWAGIAAATLLTLGLGGRVTAFVTLQLLIALFRLNGDAGGGHDRFMTNALWLLVLGDATATLSLDCRRRTGAWTSAALVSAWPRYLAVYQLVVVYTTTGLQKVGVDWMPWGDWAALYKALLLPSWRRIDMSWIGPFYPLLQLGTVTTQIFEIGAWVWILAAWYRHTRTRPGRLRAWSNRHDLRALWALLGLGLHLAIHAFMNVGPFSWISLSFYVNLWHPDEWAARWRRWRRT